MLPDCFKLKNLGAKLGVLDGVGQNGSKDSRLDAVTVMRVTDGAKAHIISQLDAKRIAVASDGLAAKSLAAKLNAYPSVKAVHFPFRDDVLLPRRNFSLDGVYERTCALTAYLTGEADVLVLAVDALLQYFPRRDIFEKYVCIFEKEDNLSPTAAQDMLSAAGYRRQDMISERGEYAVRGDILDVYSVNGKAYRVNFFDEFIENIKIIDAETMLSEGEIDRICVPPASDILLDGEALREAQRALAPYIDNSNAERVVSQLREGACNPSAVWGIPFFKGANGDLFDFFGKEAYYVLDEPRVIAEKAEMLVKEFDGRIKSLSADGGVLPVHRGAELSYSELKRRLLTARKLAFTSLDTVNPLFESRLTIQPKTRPVTKYYLDNQSMVQDLKTFALNGFKTVIACRDEDRARSIVRSLKEEDIYSEYSPDGRGEAGIEVTPLKIETGFIYPDCKVALIGVAESVGKSRSGERKTRKAAFIAPKAGDYVVHRVHGVGICEGTAIMKTGDFEKEYVVLRYRDGDVLYVASDQTDSLQKFVGEEHPRLNKLGGKEFEKEKAKVRKSVRKLAVNLIELYAKREKQKGFRYSEDTVWQREFEDAFEYEETDDQLKAIRDIKSDMESGRIMDRLLVGDVGFGKTEVAFRAMFKTALDLKQSVLLAPTTILARQHYENLIKRLEPFGIKCALISRLQTAAQNAEAIEGLADGTVTMAVATHKIISGKINFHNLGLLVLDEEQRFGVEHKEKIKEKYPEINVLTLSATPIPRTLNMALSGIRDISLLETPPAGRLPVQTYVVEYSDGLLADAVSREAARGGQTLVLVNDISRLEAFADTVRKKAGGGIRVLTAHGQLAPSDLEKRIEAFYDKRYDVLISTTIIENGIDLPDANTLVVVDADKFGLSQLYQLRGRVGRRGALAHAYFTLRPDGTLSDTADKRLRALLDNTEIGSGFRVALSDLSIRGAGTLLGAEQHGHIERVGYEMYLELLDEAVEELKTGVSKQPVREVDMKVDVAAYIREGYVGARDKLRIYKQIAAVSGEASRNKLIDELTEVYGAPDNALVNLIDVALLKNLAANYGVSKIIINRNGAGAAFYDASVFSNEALMKRAAECSDKVVLTSSVPPSMVFDVKGLSAEQKLASLIAFFGGIEN